MNSLSLARARVLCAISYSSSSLPCIIVWWRHSLYSSVLGALRFAFRNPSSRFLEKVSIYIYTYIWRIYIYICIISILRAHSIWQGDGGEVCARRSPGKDCLGWMVDSVCTCGGDGWGCGGAGWYGLKWCGVRCGSFGDDCRRELFGHLPHQWETVKVHGVVGRIRRRVLLKRLCGLRRELWGFFFNYT